MKLKHRILLLLAVFSSTTFFGQLYAGPADGRLLPNRSEKGLFWKVEKEGMSEPIYLFGTYHLLNDGYLEKWPAVLKAYDQSSSILVETEIDSSQIPVALSIGMMTDQTLQVLLDSADYFLVDQEVQTTMHIPLSQLNQMKPMMVAMALTIAYNQAAFPELSDIPGIPMDVYFASEGHKRGKNVQGFESMIEQSHMVYDSVSISDQATDLVQLVLDKDEAVEVTEAIIEAYKSNDYSAIERMEKKDMDHWGSIDHLLEDRNDRWVKQIPQIVPNGGAFIAVGAMHLVGSRGLVEQLRSQGYSVQPIPVQ
ncbi:TraB/GumN family protein [Cryomorphaceae bacterium]|nr:TraB/GumN family protein [Cryomorphaceae bacterium]